MLFTYKYISHDVEKFQEYLDFLFKEVWLKADGEFDVSKLADFPELQQIYINLGNVDYDPEDETKNKRGKFAYFFNSSVSKIYIEFAKLGDADKKLLAQLYDNNNNIEGLCEDKNIKPISYKELKAKHSNLEKVLKSFYDKLYGSSSPFNLKLFGFLNNDILPKHYEEFMKKNTEGICPFCGIHTIKENNHSFREAYDHYISKGIYPFVSLNFKNLAPMCQECNSTYKGTKVPIETDDKERKLAFYPYAKEHPKLKFEVKLMSKNILALNPADIEIDISAEKNEEQVESWKRVFGIDERYKDLICKKNVGVVWFSKIYDEFENASNLSEIENAEVLLDYELRATEKSPLNDYNFLKKGFLEECKNLGLLNANA